MTMRIPFNPNARPSAGVVMEWTTTSTILSQLRDRQNDAAWSRLVERFRAPIIAFAHKAGASQTDAEDVAQETLVEFAESFRLGRFDPSRGRLSRWIFGIAFNQILRLRQSNARREAKAVSGMDTGFWHDVMDEDRAHELWELEWEQAVLEQCIARARKEFTADVMSAFEGAVADHRSAAEVAADLGVSTKTIYNAKHRVLTRIRAIRAEIEEIG